MKSVGCDLDRIIQLRRYIHANPEIAFKEVNTQKTVIDTLISFGLEEQYIKKIAGTGVVADICGTGEFHRVEGVKAIAIRAELDALPWPEGNPELPYRSKIHAAHLSGHDGHMATLLSAAQVLLKYRHRIPKGKKIRLLF